MSIDRSIASNLFIVKKHQLKMVEARGYDISRERNLLKIGVQQFLDAYIPFAKKEKKSFREVLANIYTQENGTKLYVYYADHPKSSQLLGVADVSIPIQNIEKYKVRNLIIITPVPLSPQARKNIEGLVAYNIEIFQEKELGYNPTEHRLVPKHTPLLEDEQREFLERNGLSIDQLPILLKTDIISRYYGFLPGTVIRIERENMYDTMIEKSIYYRVVK